MLKKILSYSLLISFLASCSGLKTAFTGNKQTGEQSKSVSKKEPRFLDQEIIPESSGKNTKNTYKETGNKETTETNSYKKNSGFANAVPATPLQNKYALLLNTSPAEVNNVTMFEFIDNWYGTPYKLGGTTKAGIDCSAFTQFLFAAVYSINLPRTTKEQYSLSNRISRTELKEGDLIFFNTRGGVSHVGVYLQNNKFVHASTSGGVMISDIFEEYWVKRFVGVGRLNTSLVSGF